MKISDMIVSAILKKGLLYEARNVDVEFKIPRDQPMEVAGLKLEGITIRFKAEYMSVQVDKDSSQKNISYNRR